MQSALYAEKIGKSKEFVTAKIDERMELIPR
jgi:hypothetical protein